MINWKKIKLFLKRHAGELAIDIGIAVFVLGLIVVGGLFLWISTLNIPDLSSFEERRILQSTKIFDRTGEILLYDLHQDVKRTIVPFEEISRHIKNATVAIEDDQFYNHPGIDIRAIIRAALSNLTAGDLLGGQGGSTITQQVIKNSVLEQEKKLTRKIKEAILALRLERELSKDEILSHYLNESPYGGTIYGVEEASQAFFGKSASELNLPESAYLAALPQAPTYFSPYGNNRSALDERKNLVLKRMQINDFISEEEYNEASAVEITFEPQAVTGIRAPHFVMYIREQLAARYGEETLAERGFRVITTLDWELQKAAEEILARKVPENAELYNANNAGIVAVDPQTGDILVMVGSRNYFDEEIDGNFNITLAPRQPGSSIKPMVYASALKDGFTPETIVYDVRTQFSTACEPWQYTSVTPCYSPNNYNNQFKGPISFRNALAQSLNIPAVKALYLTGLNDAITLTRDLGITTLNDPERLGLTLVLGGGEVKLLEHVGAYGVFANEGVKAERRSILRVENNRREVTLENEVVTERVLERDVALQISSILSDNVARAPLWGGFSLVDFGQRDVAIKSGSTNNLRDAWLMGYSPNLAAGIWVGNNDNAPMGGGLSGLIATPMWREFMDIALAKVDDEDFPEPPAIDQTLKPILRGQSFDTAFFVNELIAGSSTQEVNLSAVTGGIHSILYYVNRNDPRGPYPQNPAGDSQYELWEYGVQKWKETEYGSLVPQSSTTAETEDLLERLLQEISDRE